MEKVAVCSRCGLDEIIEVPGKGPHCDACNAPTTIEFKTKITPKPRTEAEAHVRKNMDPLYFMALQAAVMFTTRTISPETCGEDYDKVFRALAEQRWKDTDPA